MNHAPEHPRPATLSLDLDNLWAYLRTKGDPAWTGYPSFLAVAVPRILDLFAETDMPVTIFVVGRDIELEQHDRQFEAIAAAGHELGNHSYSHRIDFHRLNRSDLENELSQTERLIASIGAPRPRGFRGPSFRLSAIIVNMLAERGYDYDASTFPTFAGPLARLYLRRSASHRATERHDTDDVFGGWRDGMRPMKPYRWQCHTRELVELPVTTFPVVRMPVHFTYLNFLADKFPALAETYFDAAMSACRIAGVVPSLLLHATDFIGSDDAACPRFLPGMKRTSTAKVALLRRLLRRYDDTFSVSPLGRYAASLGVRDDLKVVVPKAADSSR